MAKPYTLATYLRNSFMFERPNKVRLRMLKAVYWFKWEKYKPLKALIEVIEVMNVWVE